MSDYWLGYVIEYSRSSKHERILLMTLAYLSDESGCVSGVTHNELARITNLGIETLKSAMYHLETSKQISIEQDPGKPKTYQILKANLEPLPFKDYTKKWGSVIHHAPQIAERDGGYYCFYCGCELAPHGDWGSELPRAYVDHATPKSRGGSSTLDNFVLACSPCNCSKNNKTVDEFMEWKKQNDAW